MNSRRSVTGVTIIKVHSLAKKCLTEGSLAATALYILFLLVVPLVAHWLYSNLGFNPTDDGYYLAFSRRLLDGQIPHLDYISVHTAGSAILHLPFVLFGGDHVYLISRLFVWFQFALIALAWTRITSQLLEAKHDPVAEILIAIIGFALSCHYFPIMAWSTIDGMFFIACGLLLCLRKNRGSRAIGYFLIGAAYVCKQNYVFFAPFAIVLLDDRRSVLAWVSVALPGLVYAAVMLITGALPDAYLQLTTQTDFITPGFFKYLWEYGTAWGMIMGYIAMRLLYGRRPSLQEGGIQGQGTSIDFIIGSLGVATTVIAASFAMSEGRFLFAPSFGLFGVALGATLQFLVERGEFRREASVGILTVVTAWCTALSIGYNTPALATGLCAIYLLSLVRVVAIQTVGLGSIRRFRGILAVTVGVLLVNFHIARNHYIYLDRPATELTFPLDNVLPGGAGLLTGKNTYDFLVDLNKAIAEVPDHRYAIVPELAGYWVKSAQVNPLPIDWAEWVDLGRPELLNRVTDALEAQRGNITIIVQKVQAASLAHRIMPLTDSDRYIVARYVRKNFTLVAETRFFALYR